MYACTLAAEASTSATAFPQTALVLDTVSEELESEELLVSVNLKYDTGSFTVPDMRVQACG